MRLLKFIKSLFKSPPKGVVFAKRAVDDTCVYRYYKGFVKPKGLKPNEGNCAFFTQQYVKELAKQGLIGVPFNCVTPRGEQHQACICSGWVLDVRYSFVVAFDEYDCKPI